MHNVEMCILLKNRRLKALCQYNPQLYTCQYLL
jgi:hypothetical protein